MTAPVTTGPAIVVAVPCSVTLTATLSRRRARRGTRPILPGVAPNLIWWRPEALAGFTALQLTNGGGRGPRQNCNLLARDPCAKPVRLGGEWDEVTRKKL